MLTRMQGYKVKGIEGYKDTRIQGIQRYNDARHTRIPEYNEIRIQGIQECITIFIYLSNLSNPATKPYLPFLNFYLEILPQRES